MRDEGFHRSRALRIGGWWWWCRDLDVVLWIEDRWRPGMIPHGDRNPNLSWGDSVTMGFGETLGRDGIDGFQAEQQRTYIRRSCDCYLFSVCKEPQTKVDPAKDVTYVKGKRLPKKFPSKVYLALNKPKGSDQRLDYSSMTLYWSPFFLVFLISLLTRVPLQMHMLF
ncbi:hypothetical protein AKJ16_DCAP05817 [Drosera capensis]